MDRRQFLASGSAGLSASLLIGSFAAVAEAARGATGRRADEVARDEDFWLPVQQAYTVDTRYILLNAGGSNPSPRSVHEQRLRLQDYVNASPNIHSGRLDAYRAVRGRLAGHLGAARGEVALTRNTTEGLNIFIASLDLQPGDEILCSSEEYHVTKAAMRLREARDGAKVVAVSWPVPARSKRDIAEAFRRGFSARTKAVILCQIQHVGGQIMPVREICDEARRRGVPSCVDGALGFGHIVTNVRDMGCDYYATSLHKYLSAPLGTGLFYVREPLIARTWPLYGLESGQENSITKFEYVGTRSMADIAAVGGALDFYEMVGPERKQARLHYLKSYWMERLRDEPRIKVSVSPAPEHSCATAIVAVDGVGGSALNRHLAERHGIWCYGPVSNGPLEGVYVAPNLFTRPDQLDRFVAAMRQTVREGVAA